MLSTLLRLSINKATLVVFLLMGAQCLSQEITTQKFTFSFGTEYRITPIRQVEAGLVQRIAPIGFETERLLTGFGINYEIGWEFAKNWTFNFSHTFRYNYVYDERANSPGNFGVINDRPVFRLLMDYHFYIDKHFSLNSGKSIYIRVGKSLANRGSRFATSRIIDVPELGELGEVGQRRDGDLNWQPWNLGVGYQANKISITSGVYINNQHPFGTTTNPNPSIALPYINLSYRLKRF